MIVIARNKNILWTELDGRVALLDVDGGHYYEANKLGSVVWHFLEVPRSISDIVAQIVARFRVDQARCETDVNHFLGTLVKLGLIVEAEPTSSK